MQRAILQWNGRKSKFYFVWKPFLCIIKGVNRLTKWGGVKVLENGGGKGGANVKKGPFLWGGGKKKEAKSPFFLKSKWGGVDISASQALYFSAIRGGGEDPTSPFPNSSSGIFRGLKSQRTSVLAQSSHLELLMSLLLRWCQVLIYQHGQPARGRGCSVLWTDPWFFQSWKTKYLGSEMLQSANCT